MEIDPIELLKSLMKDHGLRPKGLADYLGVSKGYVSDILNYKNGPSKEVIRALVWPKKHLTGLTNSTSRRTVISKMRV